MSDYDVEFYPAERGNCAVCGAPGGNCVGETDYHGSINILPKKRKDPRATFRVPHRIYVEETAGSKTVKKLLYAKGDAITPDEAKRLGLIPNDAAPKLRIGRGKKS